MRNLQTLQAERSTLTTSKCYANPATLKNIGRKNNMDNDHPLVLQIYKELLNLQARVKNDRLVIGHSSVSWAQVLSAPHVLVIKFFDKYLSHPLKVNLGKALPDDARNALQIAWYRVKHTVREGIGEIHEIFKTKKICIDYTTNNYFVWDLTEQKVSKFHPDALLKLAGPHAKEIKKEIPVVKKDYDPFKGQARMWKENVEGQELQVLNLYKPPIWHTQQWTKEQILKSKEQYPPQFVQFFQFLFPKPEQQMIVLDWLALAIFNHHVAALVLRGMRGNGKTMFKHFVYHLVGSWYDAPEDLTRDFNYDFLHKRIIGMDDNLEIGTHKGHILRKRLSNPTGSFQ